MKPKNLTRTYLLLFFVFCHSLGIAQITIGAKTVIKPNTLISINTNSSVVTITDSLLNEGNLLISADTVKVASAGVLINEDSLKINGDLTSESCTIVNETISVLAYITVSGSLTLNGSAQFNNLGFTNVDQHLTASASSNIVNQRTIRVGRDYNNHGNYGNSTDTGTIRLVGLNAATFSNGSNPVYHLWLNATGTKTLSSNTNISNRLSLFDGVLQTTSSYSLVLDSLATITRPSAFDPSLGGHVEGTMRRYVEHIAGSDQLDSLYFPVGINGKFAPLLVRDMSAQGKNARFTVSTSDPTNAGNPSFDVASPLNAAIVWGLSVIDTPDSFLVQIFADTSLIGNVSNDTLIVAQSNMAEGVYESLGKSDTISIGSMRGITSEYQPDLSFLALGVNRNVKLSLKVLLQGRSNGSGAMNTNTTFTDTLNIRFSNEIIEAYRPIPDSVIDSISVSIRVATSGTDIETIPAWLMADGSIRDFRTITDTSITFAKATDATYYIVVRHRNHLTLMSSNPVSLVSNSRGQTDLTQISNIYGGGVFAITGNTGAMYAGNARNDNQEVNAGDQFDVIQGNINMVTGYERRDLDLNAVVNATDVGIADEGSFSLYFSTTP